MKYEDMDFAETGTEISNICRSQDPSFYEILDTLDSSSQSKSTTYKARHINTNKTLTIKVFPNHTFALGYAAICASITDHYNIMKVYTMFDHGGQCWIVMPFHYPNDLESLSSILDSSFPHGMSEVYVAFVLEDILKGIKHVHHERYGVHEKLDLDHVFVYKDGKRVKFDFGLSSYDNNINQEQRPLWMTPPDFELMKPSAKVDIWMFGLLAMELFYGKIIRGLNRKEFLKLVSRIRISYKKSLRSENYNVPPPSWKDFFTELVDKCFPTSIRSLTGGKMPSRLLGEVIVLCLDQNPLNRPTAKDLRELEFFRTSYDFMSMKLEFFSNPHKYKPKAENKYKPKAESKHDDHKSATTRKIINLPVRLPYPHDCLDGCGSKRDCCSANALELHLPL